MLKICTVCNKEYDYVPGNNSTTKLCACCRVTAKKKNYKHKAILLKGGRCSICGYNKCERSLDFHHIKPSTKKYNLATMFNSYSWKKIKEELDKCILVCRNCHGEIHDQLEGHSLEEYIEAGYDKFNESLQQEKEIAKQQEVNRLKNNKIKRENGIKERIQLIETSNIDFSKFGWSNLLARKIGIKSASLVRWIKKYMPDFYEEKCYKNTNIIDDSLRDDIINDYVNNCMTIVSLSKKHNCCVDTIRNVLLSNNIKINLKPQEYCVNMLSKDGKQLMQFSSITNAASYIYNNINKKPMPKLTSISTMIADCIAKRRDVAYSYKWERAS